MLTVAEAARRAGRNPETIRRRVREGKLHATKVGAQHVIDEADFERMVEKPKDELLPVPAEWQRTFWGAPMPNVVTALRRSREGH